jgi:hypothetical protein
MPTAPRVVFCGHCPGTYVAREIIVIDGETGWGTLEELDTMRRSNPRGSSTLELQIEHLRPFTFLCPHGHRVDGDLGSPLPIAIAGVSGASKSHFLAAFERELSQLRVLHEHGIRVRRPLYGDHSLGVDATDVYERNRVLPRTPTTDIRGPFGFSVRAPSHDERLLLLFDVAGEAFGDALQIAASAPHLFACRALIYLVDPVGLLPTLFEREPAEHVRIEALIAARRGAESIADALATARGIGDGSPVELPVCVVVAKADAVRWPQSFDWYEEATSVGAFSGKPSVELSKRSEHVREILELLAGAAIVADIEGLFTPELVRFACVSATSAMPANGGWTDTPSPRGTGLVLQHVLNLLEMSPSDTLEDLERRPVTDGVPNSESLETAAHRGRSTLGRTSPAPPLATQEAPLGLVDVLSEPDTPKAAEDAEVQRLIEDEAAAAYEALAKHASRQRRRWKQRAIFLVLAAASLGLAALAGRALAIRSTEPVAPAPPRIEQSIFTLAYPANWKEVPPLPRVVGISDEVAIGSARGGRIAIGVAKDTNWLHLPPSLAARRLSPVLVRLHETLGFIFPGLRVRGLGRVEVITIPIQNSAALIGMCWGSVGQRNCRGILARLHLRVRTRDPRPDREYAGALSDDFMSFAAKRRAALTMYRHAKSSGAQAKAAAAVAATYMRASLSVLRLARRSSLRSETAQIATLLAAAGRRYARLSAAAKAGKGGQYATRAEAALRASSAVDGVIRHLGTHGFAVEASP